MKEVIAASHYGPGGRNCVCCGPNPGFRKRHDRMVRRRIRQKVSQEIQKILKDTHNTD